MTLDRNIVFAVLAIFGIGVVGIIQSLKRLLKLDGAGAWALAFAVSFAATAVYLVQTHAFSLLALVLYGAAVFGEATGLYHVVTKS